MHNLASKHTKDRAKQRALEHQKAVDEATTRRNNLIERAISFGAHRKDPLYVQCVIAHYRVRPVTFGDLIVINICEDHEGRRYVGPRSRVVGHISYLPLGGLAGVRVVDAKGDLMICEGCFKPDTRWSVFTRGFHLLDIEKI
jgi:hypothetical protein